MCITIGMIGGGNKTFGMPYVAFFFTLININIENLNRINATRTVGLTKHICSCSNVPTFGKIYPITWLRFFLPY